MSMPALRQPKAVVHEKSKKIDNDVQNVILTLKDNISLVVSSDAYHGIIMGREMFKCVFCRSEMELDSKLKESHKLSQKHKRVMDNYPHAEGYGQHLIRRLDKESFYCTICNVIVSTPFLTRHITAEVHNQELEKAAIRSMTYKPLI